MKLSLPVALAAVREIIHVTNDATTHLAAVADAWNRLDHTTRISIGLDAPQLTDQLVTIATRYDTTGGGM